MMFKIFKISGNPDGFEDLDVFHKLAQQFLPHAQQKLGFDKPVHVNLVSDRENAKDPVGKTAYYDPNQMKITLFVDKRHVKDILRSLSHELVHHTQNCRGDFNNNINTEHGYAQEDDHMRKMEAEAYLKGSGFLLRDWEDSLKKENKTMNERKNVNNSKVQKESIFAPNHYCIHHGGVQMEGKTKLGKVISHNWSEKLQKVTKYDMQLEDGTIVEGVAAEDILVTEASLVEGHGAHMAKRDDAGSGPGGTSGKAGEERARKTRAAVKKHVLDPANLRGTKAAKERALKQKVKSKTFLGSVGPDVGEEATGELEKAFDDPSMKALEEDDSWPDCENPETESEKEECEKRSSVKKKAPWLDPASPSYVGEPPALKENWFKGDKDELLFERLKEKWCK